MADLKGFLLENLQNNGMLDIIKGDLKNNLFNTLREESPVKSPTAIDGEVGEKAAELVRDFFETFCMQYSLSVFLPESKLPERPYQREALEKQISVKPIDDLPLLSAIVASIKKTEDHTEHIGEGINSSEILENNKEELKKKIL